MKDIFKRYYETNYWSGKQSRSGSGSDLEETENIRRELPRIIKDYEVVGLLDIPCGGMNWMEWVISEDGFYYIGADIVPEIIEDNKERRGVGNLPNVRFDVLDITQDELPRVDVILTRDCLGHLSDQNVRKAVENVKRAKPKYFIVTHWPTAKHKNIVDGSWRRINMDYYLNDSFKLVELIEEDISGKYLGVWEL